MNSFNLLKKSFFITMILYFVIAVFFFYIAGDSLFQQSVISSMLDPSETCGELIKDTVIKQKIDINTDDLTGLKLYGATYDRKTNSILNISIIDSKNNVIVDTKLSTDDLIDNSVWTVIFDKPVMVKKNNNYYLQIISESGKVGNSVTLYYGNSVSTARAKVDVNISEDDLLQINGKTIDGQLCVSTIGTNYFFTGPHYWEGVFIIALLLLTFFLHLLNCEKKKKPNSILDMVYSLNKYSFLTHQLVSRDFKTKYKRSVLGILWSFLNPLLTMGVQFVIFSTLFKSSIENYPIYLLSGIVCYNFFNEVAGMCMTSIIGNDSLIKKVYVPKYIYPLSRSLSSCINFVFSLIPLFGVMLITKTQFHVSIFLLVFATLCLYLFSLGIGLILASLMVFFRDTQFLWGVISMIWMYATPIIYPETIIPTQLLTILKLNPLYHIVRFFRTVLINGVSPDPMSYLICIIMSLIPLLIGWFVFKKTQDKFVLYL